MNAPLQGAAGIAPERAGRRVAKQVMQVRHHSLELGFTHGDLLSAVGLPDRPWASQGGAS